MEWDALDILIDHFGAGHNSARLFSGSFESAIYLLSLICAIPESTSVLPAINSNFTHHIAASLADHTVLTGQVAISHPSGPTAVPDAALPPPPPGATAAAAAAVDALDLDEDGTLPGSLPVLRGNHVFFSKDDEEDLPARIARVWYINPYGHEIWPVANPKVLAAVEASEAVVYSIGSLYTSIVPSLILRGVGGAAGRCRTKVLVLNAKVDRETGPAGWPMTAVDFVTAVARAAKESQADFEEEVGDGEVRRYVSHVVYLEGAEDGGLAAAGGGAGGGGSPVVMPRVDVEALGRLGIACVAVKGVLVGEGRKRMMRYEEAALVEALEGILG